MVAKKKKTVKKGDKKSVDKSAKRLNKRLKPAKKSVKKKAKRKGAKKPESRRVGRPDKYDKKKHPDMVYKLCLLGAIDKEIADVLEISESTLNEWKKKYPELSESIKKGKIIADSNVASGLYKRATGYKYTEKTHERINGDRGQKQRHKGNDYKLTAKEWSTAQKVFNGECAYCGSKKKLTKDHVIPLKTGGEYTKENVVPCCSLCNCKKKDNDMDTWYKKQKFYTAERHEKIKSYLALMQVAGDVDSVLTLTKVVHKDMAPDTGAGFIWLKNRRKTEWKDKHQVEHSGAIGRDFHIKDASEKDLNGILRGIVSEIVAKPKGSAS